MIISKLTLPRRTLLRGLGVAIGLPLLDAMVPALTATGKTAAKPTPRLGYFYVPNGIYLPNWFPNTTASGDNGLVTTGDENNWDMSPTLRPLAAFKNQINVFHGLANHQASLGTGMALHAKAQTAFLSGAFLKETEGSDVRGGKTIDQYAADVLGVDTPLRSLELGTEPGFLSSVCEQGISCVYQNTMAWRTPTSPLPLENNPRVVFERLFGEGGTSEQRRVQARKDRSILDWATDSIGSFQKRLGPSDRSTVGEYLDAVRDVEHRIQMQERQQEQSTGAVGAPPIGIPENQDEHTKMLLDLQFLAFQADITRVSTYMIRREESQATYPQIGVPEAHHWTSHHSGSPDKIAMVSKINTHHVSLLSHLVGLLAKTQDGEGTLLDHTVLAYGAGFGDGNLHNAELVPLMIIGGGCGTIKGGRFMQTADRTPMTNVGLAVLNKVGVPLEQVGDSTGPLVGL